jgi:HK97 family phage portal protein
MRARVGDQWTLEHPILDLLAHPNPFMDAFELWATVIMHLSLAGNAYLLKIRSRSGKLLELWPLRPDRIRIVPDAVKFISHYEYDAGGVDIPVPVEDIIHIKKRHPLNAFYGMPPLLPISGRVDIDNFMRDFVKSFFKNAGVPGGILNIKGSVSPDVKDEIKRRYNTEYGGIQNWHKLLVIDGADASFTAMTSEMGTRGLVIPELNKIEEIRIIMAFQVPPELIGAMSGMESSSYAQKRAARESFWDETLAPLYKEISGPLNSSPRTQSRMGLTAEFPGVQEVGFDLSDVRALREDVDKLHTRVRLDVTSGLRTIEEGRIVLGIPDVPADGTFLIPANLVPVAASEVKAGTVDLRDVRSGDEVLDGNYPLTDRNR